MPLGYDLGDDQNLRQRLSEACAEGNMIAIDGGVPEFFDGEHSRVVILYPTRVRNGATGKNGPEVGFAGSLINVNQVFRNAIQEHPTKGVEVELHGPGGRLSYHRLSDSTRTENEPLVPVRAKTFRRELPIRIADLRWTLVVRSANRSWEAQSAWLAPMGAGSIFIFTLVAAGLLGLVEHQQRRSKRLAEERADTIAQLKKTQEKLAGARDRYEELVRRIPVGVYRFRGGRNDGVRMEYVSPRFCQITDMTREEINADPERLYEAAHPEDRDEFRRMVDEAVEDMEDFCWEGRFIVDGETRWLHIESRPTVRPNGDRIWHGIIHDVTERRETEQQLENTNRQLEETVNELRRTRQQLIDQERHRALCRMASGIAHDFNNALSPIQGYTDLLLQNPDKLRDPETVERYLEQMNDAAQQAAETVRRMRKFYKKEQQEEYQKVDLNTLMEEVRSATRPHWEEEASAQGKTIRVEMERADIPNVFGSQSDLHEMLVNLVFNAVDAIAEEGTITLRTRQEDEQSVVEVEDTGRGMDEEERIHCTDPFFSTKTTGGRGLGLSVSEGIVNRHEGSMQIESEEGVGTRVIVRLPAVGGKEEDEPSTPDAAETGPCRILVIDDDPMQRSLLKEMLGSLGHEVDLASDGQSGLEKFDAGQHDVVITDRAMPEMAGDEVARLIRERAPGTPIIMLTGFGDVMGAADERPEHVDVLKSKPVSIKKLKEAIGLAMQAV